MSTIPRLFTGIGIGIGVGASLILAVRAPALAQQSGPAPAPTPTLARPNAAVVGQLPERTMMYTKRAKTKAVIGGVSTVTVDCNSASDVPVAGACNAPNNAAATVQGNDMTDWANTQVPARWRCSFVNPGPRIEPDVEAVITCKKTQ